MADETRLRSGYQADERETDMRKVFNLGSSGKGRGGQDAVLSVVGHEVPFELKSTDVESISTARDVGREHIARWRHEHWLFGFYERGTRTPEARFYIYASPEQLEPWIGEQAEYAAADWTLAEMVPQKIDLEVLERVVTIKTRYTLKDAASVLKQQKLEAGERMTEELRQALEKAGLADPRKMTVEVYRLLMDLHDGFSAARLAQIRTQLQDPPDKELPDITASDDTDFDQVLAKLNGRRFHNGKPVTKPWLKTQVDIPAGYSQNRMLALLRERCRYLLERGATRNNPHITVGMLRKLVPQDQVIPGDSHELAGTLRDLVRRQLRL